MTREFAQFAVVGLGGVLVNFAVFNMSAGIFGVDPVKASILGTACAIWVNYLGYRFWVYRGNRKHSSWRAEVFPYGVLSGTGLMLENGILYTTHNWLKWDGRLEDNLFKLLGLCVAALFRFFTYRRFVFRYRAK